MSEQAMLLELERRAEAESAPEPVPVEKLKLRRPNRNQFTYAAVDVEALIGPQHPARAIWELTGRLSWRRLPSRCAANKGRRGGRPGSRGCC